MTDQYIISFDPGLSTGICLGVVGDSTPFKPVKRWQVSGGLVGLVGWLGDSLDNPFQGLPGRVGLNPFRVEDRFTVISEKFTPLQNKGFSLTLGAVEPLRAEGALVALGVMPDYPTPEWRRPVEQYIYGGKTLAEKKKLAKQFLKDNGMYLTGKDVQAPDADDAISATLHALSYCVRVLRHKPTFDLLSAWNAVD